jgi:hypothetical protein
MRSLPRYSLIAFVIFHLLFVAVCGVCNIREVRPAGLQTILSVYGNYTGADGRYGFFAPHVSEQIVMTVIGREASGREYVEEHRGSGPEAELRLTTFLHGMVQIPVYDTPAAAFSVEMFNRLPTVQSVTILLSRYEVPTMAQYRQGQRPTSIDIYRATFIRKAPLVLNP